MQLTGEMILRKATPDSVLVGCPHIDLVELPRIKLTLFAKKDHLGEMRLYSMDHSDLYVTNDRTYMTTDH